MRKADLHITNKAYRFTWNIINFLLFRTSPRIFFKWRVFLLKLFGCKCEWSSRVYPMARIWSPVNLTLGHNTTVANCVDIYNVAPVNIGAYTTLSDKVFLCTASKTFNMKNRQLLVGNITIGAETWIASCVSILPNVDIGDKVVILFGAIVDESIPSNSIVKSVKNYEIKRRKDEH